MWEFRGPMFLPVLQRGAGLLDAQARERIRIALLSSVDPAEGFRGRDGRPDVYYAPFAMAVMVAIGSGPALSSPGLAEALHRAARKQTLDPVHRCSLAQAWALLGDVRQARRTFLPVGEAGFSWAGEPSHASGCGSGSPYACFLMALTCRTLELPLPALTPSRWRTVPEASGLLVLQRWQGNSPDPEALALVERCLDSGGGVRASPEARTPDLLCTATGLLALEAHRPSRADPAARLHARFVSSCWRDSGLFAASPDDPDPCGDPEYSFYALLALGCLAGADNGKIQEWD